MTTLRAFAPSKINLALFLGETRPDGYHELVSVVQPLDLGDRMTLEPAVAGTESDRVVCPGVEEPNLATAALRAYREATGWDGPAQRLTIAKQTPVAAGMGGGSSDAAAALRLIAHAAGKPDDPVVDEIAPKLGADVPALLRPQLTLTGGAGEVLEPLSPLAPYEVVVLASREQLSTADVFAEADRLGLGRSADELAERRAALAAAFTAGAELPLELLQNDLEPAARSLCPSIEEAMQFAQRMGAEHAMVTGSGPTVVAFFRPRRGEPKAADRLDMHGTVVLSSFSRIAIAAPLTPGAAAVREERRG